MIPGLPMQRGRGVVRTYYAPHFYGVVVGPIYLTVKDTRSWPLFYTERNRIGCRHVTVGHWRWGVRWSVPA